MRQHQRVAAYGVCRTGRDGGGVVLVRLSERSDLAGRWLLPGGGLDHGEAPEAAVIREFAEETGLNVAVVRLRDVLDDVRHMAHRDTSLHTVRLIYDVQQVSGRLRAEVDGSSDQVAVVRPGDADHLELTAFTARVLGSSRPAAPLPQQQPVPQQPPHPASPIPPDPPAGDGATGGPLTRVRRQRVAVYGLIHDDGHVLLTRLSAATPAPGRWALPGGGIDHGESAPVALAREVYEEAGLRLRGAQLLTALSNRFLGTSPSGAAEDFHGVPVLYRVEVDASLGGGRVAPRVTEIGGTTDAAAWVPLGQLAELPLTRMAAQALRLVPGAVPAGGGVPT